MNLSEAVRLERDKRKRQAFIWREQGILSVCESLMAEKDVRQVPVDMFAARTGIGKDTFYKHFDTKRDVNRNCSAILCDVDRVARSVKRSRACGI